MQGGTISQLLGRPLKPNKNKNCWQEDREIEICALRVGMENSTKVLQNTENRFLPGIYPEELETGSQLDTCTSTYYMFIVYSQQPGHRNNQNVPL